MTLLWVQELKYMLGVGGRIIAQSSSGADWCTRLLLGLPNPVGMVHVAQLANELKQPPRPRAMLKKRKV